MTVTELLKDLTARGIRLRADGDNLVVAGPKGALTPELAGEIRSHKPELLDVLGDAVASSESAQIQPVQRLAPGEEPPLAPAQQRFWELQRIAIDPTIYNLPGAFRLEGPLDREALRYALQRLVERHDILRSRFVAREGKAKLEIADRLEVELPVDDLRDVPEAEREAALIEHLEVAADKPLDVEAGPPFEVRLVVVGDEEHALLFVPHSMVWDGWSFDLLLSELKAHYEEKLGLGDPLPPLPIQYQDYAAWQRERVASGALDRDFSYWRRKLRGPIPALALQTDRPREKAQRYDGAREGFVLEKKFVEGVRGLARQEGATTYMVILAALKILMQRYSGVDDILIASPLQGRNHPDFEDLVGVFVNTLFFRTKVEPEDDFRSFLRRVSTTCLEAVDHQQAPSERVVEIMNEEGSQRSPYEAIFIFQQTSKRATDFGPVRVRSIRRGTRRVAVDLVVWMREYDDYFDGGFDYQTALFDAATVRRMNRHLLRILEQAIADPDRPLEDLDLVSEEERTWIAQRALETAPAILSRLSMTTILPNGRVRRIAVLDAAGRTAPVNVPGELFVEAAAGSSEGATSDFEATGLTARWKSDGKLELVERGQEPARTGGDSELDQVGAVLAGHPDIADATAGFKIGGGAEPRLIGYVVWGTADPPLMSELRRFTREHLPDHLVPGVIVELDEIPRTGSGTVDRKALPNPLQASAPVEHVAPRTPAEETVAAVWRELLELNEVGIHDNFFELGGHSLLAIRAVALIEERLRVTIDARSLFFHSLEQVAAQAAKSEHEESSATA